MAAAATPGFGGSHRRRCANVRRAWGPEGDSAERLLGRGEDPRPRRRWLLPLEDDAWCDRNDIRYVFSLPRNSVVEGNSAEWMAQVKEAHGLDGCSHRRFGELWYAAKTWDRPRRVIVKAEYLRGENCAASKANPRYVVANLAGDARVIYEDIYCARGNMENRIKEQQYGLFADRTSCHGFAANQFRVLLAAFAYVLVEHIRRTALVGTELEKAQVGTIRLRLFRVGALVVTSVRRLVVRMSEDYPLRDVFARVAERLQIRAGVESS